MGLSGYLPERHRLAKVGLVHLREICYLDTEAFVPEKAARRVQIMLKLVERVGEPMLTGFDPATLAADLASLGLRLQEDLSPADIEGRFFEGRPDAYHACEHAHLARVTVA